MWDTWCAWDGLVYTTYLVHVGYLEYTGYLLHVGSLGYVGYLVHVVPVVEFSLGSLESLKKTWDTGW